MSCGSSNISHFAITDVCRKFQNLLHGCKSLGEWWQCDIVQGHKWFQFCLGSPLSLSEIFVQWIRKTKLRDLGCKASPSAMVQKNEKSSQREDTRTRPWADWEVFQNSERASELPYARCEWILAFFPPPLWRRFRNHDNVSDCRWERVQGAFLLITAVPRMARREPDVVQQVVVATFKFSGEVESGRGGRRVRRRGGGFEWSGKDEKGVINLLCTAAATTTISFLFPTNRTLILFHLFLSLLTFLVHS